MIYILSFQKNDDGGQFQTEAEYTNIKVLRVYIQDMNLRTNWSLQSAPSA